MIDAHRGAFEYDWRARFRKPLTSVGRSMTWGEALRLTGILLADPSSQVGAAVAGWEHPVTREAMAAYDLFDLTHHIAWAQGGGKGGKPKPYPRPWLKKGRRRTGPDPSLTQDEIIAALRKAGHTMPIPTR